MSRELTQVLVNSQFSIFNSQLFVLSSFQVIVHRKGFAVKYCVSVLAYPISQNNKAAGVGKHQVQLYVPVTEYEIVYIRVSLEILLGIDNLKLLILAQVFVSSVQAMVLHAFLGPALSQPHTPAGGQQGKEELAETVPEYLSE